MNYFDLSIFDGWLENIYWSFLRPIPMRTERTIRRRANLLDEREKRQI